MNITYTDPTKFLTSLTAVWNQYKKCDALHTILQAHYESISNPYESALMLARHSPDYNLSRPNGLTFTVIEQFSNWISLRKGSYRHCLTDALKKEAFQVASRQRCRSISKLIVNVYQLNEDKNLFIQSLYDLLQLHMYKEVCEWSVILELQEEFGIYDFIIPLIFQDKLTVVDEFLKSSPRHHLELIKFLDNVLGSENIPILLDKLIVDLRIDNVKHIILPKLSHPKTLCKLVKRFVSLHKVPPDVTPNLSLRNGKGTINFLVRKRYFDGTLSKEAFREMVYEACGSRQELIAHLIDKLDEENDPNEALICARLFSLPPSEMPVRVKELHEIGWKEDDSEPAEPEDALSSSNRHMHEYHPFSLPLTSIIIVDSEKSFESLIDSKIDGASVVGMDLEWKPTMVVGAGDLALLQLATENKVFLIDVLTLSNFTHLWRRFAEVFLNNHSILKLGFAMGADTTMLAQCFPIDFTLKMSGQGFLDLSKLWNKLIRDFNFEFPFEANESCSSSSLSQLVALCLGKPLDKCEQFSNWEIRPLRQTQKVYAALDAYCLIEVYNVIKRLCSERDIPLDDIVLDLMLKVEQGNKTKKIRTKKGRGEVEGCRRPPTAAKDLKFVCEPGLAFLGKLLRRNGMDTVIAESPEDIPYIAEEENRIALTLAWQFKTVSNKLPNSKCYFVKRCESRDQYNEIIKSFNVILKSEDQFSICKECNNKNVVKIRRETVEEWKQSQCKEKGLPPAGYSDCDDEYDSDDLTPQYSDEEPSYSYTPASPALCQKPRFRFDLIPMESVNKTEVFYGCEDCGYCDWVEIERQD